MKIRAFHVSDGDCVLIQGGDDTVVLVDGGRKGTFEKNVASHLTADELGSEIDLLYLSHIDNDHISGALSLIKTIIGWQVVDHHASDTTFTGKPPSLPRPTTVRQIWHNGFVGLVDDSDGKVQDALELTTRTLALSTDSKLVDLFELYQNLANGVADTLDLNYRLEFGGKLDILNTPSDRDDGLMVLSASNERHPVGEFTAIVLGPTIQDLEALRVEWNAWLTKHKPNVPEIRRTAEEESRATGIREEDALLELLLAEASKLGEGSGGVSPPNVASLSLVLDDGTRKILLTGDARSEELLRGLRQQGLMTETEGLHVDVLKVQHHGAAGNVTEEFCKFVTADHYIFCANGSHSNPEKVVLDGFLDFRVGDKAQESASPVPAGRAFTFWFTTHSTTKGISDNQKRFLESVEAHLADNWDAKPEFTRKYPDADVDAFSIAFEV